MKEYRSLQRILQVFEAAHVALLSCCLSLPLLFLVPEYPDRIQLLWALGAAPAVLAVYALCLVLKKRLLRLLASLAVLALCLLVLPTTLLRVIYGAMLALQMLIGIVLPRPDGKPVLSVPRVYHAPFFLLLYAFSRIEGNAVMKQAAIAVTLLYLLVLLLHQHTRRLRSELCDYTSAALEDRRILRSDRRMILVFAVVGTVLILAVPLLFSRGADTDALSETAPEETGFAQRTDEPEETGETEQTGETGLREDAVYQESGRPVNTEIFTNILLVILYLILLSGLVLALISYILWLVNLRRDRELHTPPQESAGLPDEQLAKQPRKAAAKEPIRARSPTQRIRRLYRRLIRARTASGAKLSALTPNELEQAAALRESEARRTLHTLYEKARYSGAACSRADYLAAKAAAQQLRKGDMPG